LFIKKKKKKHDHQRQAACHPPSRITPRERGHGGASKYDKKANSTTKWCLTHRTNRMDVTHSLIYNEDASIIFFNKKLIIRQKKHKNLEITKQNV
jgi:hypothetical protein